MFSENMIKIQRLYGVDVVGNINGADRMKIVLRTKHKRRHWRQGNAPAIDLDGARLVVKIEDKQYKEAMTEGPSNHQKTKRYKEAMALKKGRGTEFQWTINADIICPCLSPWPARQASVCGAFFLSPYTWLEEVETISILILLILHFN